MGSVSDFIKDRRKKNPQLRVGSLNEIAKTQVWTPMSSGNVAFDYATSIGGVPRGRVTEIRGFNSAGKTTAAAMIAAQHQKRVKAGTDTGAVLYLDFEYAVDETYFANLGLDVHDEETFVYAQPENLEEGFQLFLDMTKAGLLALCVVDSVAGASAEAEYDAHIGKMSVGLKARALNQSMRMCVGPMRVHGTGLILINHTQETIPTSYSEKQMAARGIKNTVSPGGKAMEYYPSMRIELQRPSNVKVEKHDELTNEKVKMVDATEVVMTVFKSKVGVPHRQARLRVEFGKGFSNAYSVFHILVDHKVIKKKPGGMFEFPEEYGPTDGGKIPRGEDNVIELITRDPEWLGQLNELASELVLKVNETPTAEEFVIGDNLVAEGQDVIDEETGEIVSPESDEEGEVSV